MSARTAGTAELILVRPGTYCMPVAVHESRLILRKPRRAEGVTRMRPERTSERE